MIVLADPSMAAQLKGQTVICKKAALPFEVVGGKVLKDKESGDVCDILLKDSHGLERSIQDCWHPQLYEVIRVDDKPAVIARCVLTKSSVDILAYHLDSYQGFYFSSQNPDGLKRLKYWKGKILPVDEQKSLLTFIASKQKEVNDIAAQWLSICSCCGNETFIATWGICDSCDAHNKAPVGLSSRNPESWDLKSKVQYVQENLDQLSQGSFKFAQVLLMEYAQKSKLSLKQTQVLDKFVREIFNAS